ncbi:uncharacterized protein PV09_08188 [Verruconis gallopava]|uniref:Cytochrome P450 n=1 Tax=Verruconis gallopava TaxID=253628 RepID=A0A0D2A0V4_9PEZI|nr:uncharacterized protein PV09_08188 [Verruconis gallopava]KIW00298.1 hypothetical protein PV09_08188 [Verruconis gallopava]
MEWLRSLPTVAVVPLCGLSWAICTCVYRLWFHPLAKFPGPKLAALTTWYEGYYDCIGYKGRYTFKLEELHKKYGPIVRIGPNELHVKDPDYYAQLYNMSNRLDKYDWYYGMLGNPEATFPCIKHEVHKIRRGALNPFFSPAAVLRFHPVVQRVADRLTDRMKQSIEEGKPIPVFFAFRCLTVDIICEYLFGKQLHLVDREDWGRSFYSAWRGLWEMSPMIRQFPFLLDMFRMTPRWLLALTNPKALEVLDMEKQTDSWTKELLESNPEDIAKKEQKTVLWELAHSDSVPPEEKTFERLAIDGNNILAAGFETTGTALSHLMYGVLENPEIHKKLYKELEEAIPDPDHMPNHRELEKLPYFHAVIKEGIRHGVGAYGRLSRVNKKESMRYKDWVIPAGCAIGMSPYYVLWDPEIFKDPSTFKPERWLEPDAQERLEPYYIAFGRGPRACVGLNLAYAELYTVFAAVIRRFPTLKLYETNPEDVVAEHDFFGGMWKFEEGNMSLQVKG